MRRALTFFLHKQDMIGEKKIDLCIKLPRKCKDLTNEQLHGQAMGEPSSVHALIIKLFICDVSEACVFHVVECAAHICSIGFFPCLGRERELSRVTLEE